MAQSQENNSLPVSFLNLFKNKNGTKGDTGEAGVNATISRIGEFNVIITNGVETIKIVGEAGQRGSNGFNGAKGEKGEKGDVGKDGATIETLIVNIADESLLINNYINQLFVEKTFYFVIETSKLYLFINNDLLEFNPEQNLNQNSTILTTNFDYWNTLILEENKYYWLKDFQALYYFVNGQTQSIKLNGVIINPYF